MRVLRRSEAWPKATTFAVIGLCMSFGAPLGLFVLRCIAAPRLPTVDFIETQLEQDSLTYAYLMIATMIVFVVLGRELGGREDALAKTSITDPLTKLHNRRHIHGRLSEEVARAVRHDTPFALMLVDVDRLKEINDRGGHDAGDRALVCVGDALRGTCRATDLPARYGGDEFVVLLPLTTAVQAKELAERIRARLRACSTDLPIPLTVSMGIADLSVAAASPDALFAAADAATYEAKKAGRDCAVIAASKGVEVAAR